MVKRCALIVIFLCLSSFLNLSSFANWTSETFQCPETGYPLYSSDGPPPSGTIFYNSPDNSSATICLYDQGKYELDIYWRRKDPAPKKPVVCHNDGSYYESDVRGKPDPVYEVRGYYTRDGLGLHIEEIAGEFFIEYVEPYSPAFEAGLKRDEKIVELDGNPVAGKLKNEVLKTTYQIEEAKKPIKLKVQAKNSDKLREVTLKVASYDSTGQEIVVYSTTRFARAQIHLDPRDSMITQDIKNKWIGIAKEVVKTIEPKALPCR